jgi:spectinomycin phosphotransferase
MLAPPTNLDTSQLVRALDLDWRLCVDRITYLAVGFGAHHWDVRSDTRRFFVTVHDLHVFGVSSDPLGALERTFQAALRLRKQARLEFIATAVPSRTSSTVVRLSGSFALSVQEWIDVQPLQDPLGSIAASVVARLHQASAALPNLDALREDFAIPNRAALERALRDLDVPWRTGPFGERARTLLAGHQVEVRRALDDYDRHVAEILRQDHDWCLTHGEPNGWNLVQDTAGAPHLVDWDSARIAPPERDLWVLDHQPESLQTYVQLIGGTVPDPDILRLYRLWWDLAETAVYTLQFRAPHMEDANMAESWQNMQVFVPTRERWPDIP